MRQLTWILFLQMASLLQLLGQNDSLPDSPRKFLRNDLSGLPRYYYTSKDFGSEALYNPLSLLLNSGYDILQLSNNDNRIFKFPFATSAKYTFKNLVYPGQAIRDVGIWKWTKTEVLPFTFTRDGAQWVPNYLLHMIGGGMTYVAMAEWYDHHRLPFPRVFSALTFITVQLCNEIIENQGWQGTNADPIADVYIFNIAGILLFTSPKVNHFFSHTLHMADWSVQPSLTVPNGALENNGQFFSFKYSLPFYKPLHLFMRLGMGSLIGLSFKFENNYALSLGGGVRTYQLGLIDSAGRQVTVSTRPSVGIFLDRNNTVIASLVWSNVPDYSFQANVYPGILRIKKFSPGLWLVAGTSGYVSFGITSRYTLGVGFGAQLNAGY